MDCVCTENNHCPHEAGYDAFMCGCGKSCNASHNYFTRDDELSGIDVMCEISNVISSVPYV